jgi:Protein of unknown function (DUF1566)
MKNLMNQNMHPIKVIPAICIAVLATACGGGSGEPAVVTTTSGVAIAPPLSTCTPAPVVAGITRFSRVFSGCNHAGVAQYYELDECVRDNTTGLIWQGQTLGGTGLRANDQYKSNYDSTTSLQKWTGSSYVAPSPAEINDINNSIGFKNAVNTSNLCGSTAWRLPTKDELLSIVKTSESPKIDNTAFPNTPQQFGWYWTASAYEGGSYRTTAAWVVGFDQGSAEADNRNLNFAYHHYLVRLVRN